MKPPGKVEVLFLRSASFLTLLALLGIAWLAWRHQAEDAGPDEMDPAGGRQAAAAAAQCARFQEHDATDVILERIARLSQQLDDERGRDVANARRARISLQRIRAWRQSALAAIAAEAEAPSTAVRTAPAPEQVAVTARRKGERVDVLITWNAPASATPLRYEVWRWAAQQAPEKVVADLDAVRYLDAGLPGANQLGYVIYSVTPGEAFSTSEGRAVLVDLPPVHAVELLEHGIPEREEPPPLTPPEKAPPPSSERPESVTLRIRRLEDGQSETVRVKVGDRVGDRIRTALVLLETRWVECRRPVRYQEPVFQPDGRVVLDGGEVLRRSRTENLPMYLPEAILRDAWGRSIRLSPPLVPPTFRAGSD